MSFMKYVTCTLGIMLIMLISPSVLSETRMRRFLTGFNGLGLSSIFHPTVHSQLGARHCGHPDNCPIHHCRVDDAVILGYCCGCARVTDSVPVRCPPFLTCPPSPQPLCSQYDWMMDCCC